MSIDSVPAIACTSYAELQSSLHQVIMLSAGIMTALTLSKMIRQSVWFWCSTRWASLKFVLMHCRPFKTSYCRQGRECWTGTNTCHVQTFPWRRQSSQSGTGAPTYHQRLADVDRQQRTPWTTHTCWTVTAACEPTFQMSDSPTLVISCILTAANSTSP